MTASETIVAVSSPPGRSPRGLIRIAGPAALGVLDTLVNADPGRGEERGLPERTLTPVRLKSPPIPALLLLFRAPRSYTGDDLAELQVPGHPALLDRLLHQAIHAGARLAEPGEFTFRAFTAGKLDLTEAEGVAATIAATSDGQLRAAAMLRAGQLGRFAEKAVDALGTQLALVEAGIDFTDQEDVVPITPGALDANLAAVEAELASLLSRSRSWSALEALPRVVLVGPPSAGKSTLFNALLGRRRAVISPTPGTTRDVLAEPLRLTNRSGQPFEVMLVDIAGLDEPSAALDREAQAAARRAIDAADLVLSIVDPLTAATAPNPASTVDTKGTLKVATKADLRRVGDADVSVSAITGEGLDRLRELIADRLGDAGVSLGGESLALQPRHETALRHALDHVRHARATLAPQRRAHAIDRVELVAGSLRAALDELAGLGGRLTPDDVIGRVFATFCVGK